MRRPELVATPADRVQGAADRGMVTAEAAVAIPALVGVAMLLLWGLAAGLVQTQCGDAARAGARAVARGEPHDTARRLALAVAPADAVVEIAADDGLHRVRVSAPAAGPLPLSLAAEGVAHAEPD